MVFLKKRLVLASRSPRRQQLLRQLGLDFEVRESGVDERFDEAVGPTVYVKVLSERKAKAVAGEFTNAIIVGADTIVVVDDRVLGKPNDEADARDMLDTLSGREHEVYTGVTLLDRPSDQSTSIVERTRVRFRSLSPEEIRSYVEGGSPMDKAGAYGIQDDYGAVFVENIDGCFYNVVGFPLTKFYTTIQEFQRRLGLT